jgi:hypothetical protein
MRFAEAMRERASWTARDLLGTQQGCGTPASAKSLNSGFTDTDFFKAAPFGHGSVWIF